MKNLKSNVALGPNGIPATFYKTYWNIVGEDISTSILKFLNNQEDPNIFNNTFISLIPKTKTPTNPTNFRPIELCNIIMKTFTKTITNGIKHILPTIVSENQSVFVHCRLVINNPIEAYEVFNYLNKTTRSKKGYVGIKIDKEKVYDRLNWNFIHPTLINIGFPTNLTNFIIMCITFISFFYSNKWFPN